MARDYQKELDAATAAIVDVIHPKKIIVAGAGAGKTFTFGKLLDKLTPSAKERRLVMTFLGGLRRDLNVELGHKSRVQTFHGYCFTLLKQNTDIRSAAGFTASVRYVPRIGQLIKSDWAIFKGSTPPAFVPSLRALNYNAAIDFFLARGSYYDAVGYDDSTVHIHHALITNPVLVPTHDLIVVDEVQDLNCAEVSIIDLLSSKSNIVLAGDDDQALYGSLRDASEEHIRRLYQRSDYLQRNLPFCMRCPSVVVASTNDIIAEADRRSLLGGRIKKTYEPFPRAVDEQYNSIKVVQTTVQTPQSNLFGKYILESISKIPPEEILESRQKGYPTALIIGMKPYAPQVKTFLEANGYTVDTKSEPEERIDEPFKREDGLEILEQDDRSNLGWRILLETEKPADWQAWVRESVIKKAPLYQLIDRVFREAIVSELKTWNPQETTRTSTAGELAVDRPSVRITSFEGAKGMSAQHVFVLGLEDGKFPVNRNAIRSIDVRRMIVALTRTRKQCHLLMTKSSFSGGQRRQVKPSIFVEWIQRVRCEAASISAASFSDRSHSELSRRGA